MLSGYDINLKDLKTDRIDYDYLLDDAFFGALEDSSIKKGNVNARVHVEKLSSGFRLALSIDGEVMVPCDRCLDDMPQEVQAESELRVKFGEQYKDDGDDLIVIEEDKGIINVAWFLYEVVALAVPIYHVHEPGQCNEKMEEILSGMLREENESGELSKNEESTDPRWDGLKKLLNN